MECKIACLEMPICGTKYILVLILAFTPGVLLYDLLHCLFHKSADYKALNEHNAATDRK
jgi:hypothetical protein